MLKYPIEMIVWDDHYSKDDWCDIEKFENKYARVTSVGWLVKEDEKAVTICLNIGDDDVLSNAMVIIKSCIVERKRIKNAIQEKGKQVRKPKRKEIHIEASESVLHNRGVQEEEKEKVIKDGT